MQMRGARVQAQRAVDQIFERLIGWGAPRGRGGMPLERLAGPKTSGDLRLALFVDAHDRVGRRKVGLSLLDSFGGVVLDVLGIFHVGSMPQDACRNGLLGGEE